MCQPSLHWIYVLLQVHVCSCFCLLTTKLITSCNKCLSLQYRLQSIKVTELLDKCSFEIEQGLNILTTNATGKCSWWIALIWCNIRTWNDWYLSFSNYRIFLQFAQQASMQHYYIQQSILPIRHSSIQNDLCCLWGHSGMQLWCY